MEIVSATHTSHLNVNSIPWWLKWKNIETGLCLIDEDSVQVVTREYVLRPFFFAVPQPAIALPSKIEDHNPIRCRRCDTNIGTG
ncbi:MAG: hypothetical protein JO094_03945 [Hyphomicrobiales bacterium]|nr:hypothetical protein [Hyphomicrobiales bacterium]MBV9977461.1 hypothetical protein [Hyphomicrobiales bacterium]